MNRMEKVVEELEALNKMVAIDLENVEFKNRGSIAIAKADAENRIKSIESEYKEMLRTRAFTIFTSGNLQDQKNFGELAQLEGEVVVVSSQELYEQLATTVEASLGATRQFGGTALNFLIRAVEDAARQTGTGRLIQSPRLEDIAICKTTQDVVDTCRGLVLKATGPELAQDFLEHLAFKRAFEQGISKNVIPVIVVGNSKEDLALQPNVFNGRGFEAKIPATVDKEFVLDTFKKVKSEVSGKKSKG